MEKLRRKKGSSPVLPMSSKDIVRFSLMAAQACLVIACDIKGLSTWCMLPAVCSFLQIFIWISSILLFRDVNELSL